MISPLTPIEGRIRRAGIFVLIGLSVEVASFFRLHPLAFLIFLGVGGGLIFLGIADYLLSLLDTGRPSPTPPTESANQ